jgi:hypothetical protein
LIGAEYTLFMILTASACASDCACSCRTASVMPPAGTVRAVTASVCIQLCDIGGGTLVLACAAANPQSSISRAMWSAVSAWLVDH